MPAANELDLLGGALALDFANTAAGRGTPGFVDYLRTGADLLDWAVHAGITEAGATDHLTSNLADGQGTRLLDRAIALREAIYRAGAAIADGQTAAAQDLAAIRDNASEAMASAPLHWNGKAYDFDFSAGPPGAALLGPIAWSALEVLASGGFERLKQCPSCGWLFIDRSKNNSRRWCDMATCGNLNKSRSFRARH